MKKRIYQLMMACLASFALTGCSSDDDPQAKTAQDIALTRAEQQVAEHNTAFALHLYQQLSETRSGNFTVSPFSLGAVLSALSNGASGSTAQEINAVLQQDGATTQDVNHCYSLILSQITQLDNTVTLEIANSLWVNEDIHLKSAFEEIAEDVYDMEVENLNFQQSDAVSKINQWCAKHTHNRITSILNQLNGGEKLFLLNALYFNGKWANPFKAANTTLRTFQNPSGPKYVNMMNKVRETAYVLTDRFAMVDLPYGNGAFSMSVLLPETEDAIPTAEDWAELTGNLQSKKVNLYLPKFTFETTMDLIETMKAMGMPTAFSTSADFSQLADESLYISLLKQKTYVSVDESGTEAAAVTSTGMMTTAVVPVDDTQPILFEANRPFTFVIRERSTGVILFMGYVEQL